MMLKIQRVVPIKVRIPITLSSLGTGLQCIYVQTGLFLWLNRGESAIMVYMHLFNVSVN